MRHITPEDKTQDDHRTNGCETKECRADCPHLFQYVSIHLLVCGFFIEIYIYFPISRCSQTELAKYTPIAKSSSDQQPFIHHSDSAKANTTDVSECSTNTEDYVTCTDASKRGTKPPSASSSSTTQVPGSNSERYVRCEFDVIVSMFLIIQIRSKLLFKFHLCRCDDLLLLILIYALFRYIILWFHIHPHL